MTTKTPTITNLPAVRVLSLRSVMLSLRVQEQLWEMVFEFAKAHDVRVVGPTFAIIHKSDGGMTDVVVDVEVCLPIAKYAQVPKEKPFKVRNVPAVDRAVVMPYIYPGPDHGFYDGYETLFRWIGLKKLTPVGPSREVYVKRPTGNSEEDKDIITEIQLPIA
ncbi:hypothetical protein PHMEG_00016596 [Phytophthora megakarya]|uniref:AraC effector-binding domain-containing protein n=1 Tax=Phytophthora megakarya TaxID=4795 RepID=A0A225VYW8_9STRA|nr:hypothetical protein PHMEG_00016596 [Phytophthora megakarya]